MKRSLIGWFAGVSLSSLSMVSCGPGAAGEAVRPADPTAKGALGEAEADAPCRSVASYGEPLVVDWKSNERLDLEVAMKDGVAVVAYDCKTIKLLKACKLGGSYGFAGVSRKEDVIQITSSDELAANLPLSSVTLGGEVKRGSSIDLALILVGKKGTTVAEAGKPELTGSCDGATHFVKGAFVGAFAMATGTNGKVRAVAEMFGASASAASASEKKTANKDGDLEACRKATADAASPPDQCQAAIRVELVPLVAERAAGDGKAGAKEEGLKNPCPQGMVLSGGKCSTPEKVETHLCDPKNAKECVEQCDKGDPGSCLHLAYLHRSGKDVPKDIEKASSLFQKSCDGGVARACYAKGDELMVVRMNAKDEGAKTEARIKAEQYYNKACELGDGWVCWNIADWYLREGSLAVFPKDPARAASLVRRGCNLGYAYSCSTLAGMLIKGEHTTKDVPAALDLLRRACDGGRLEDCEAIGNVYRKGEAVPKDGNKAIESYTRSCRMGGMRACNSAGVIYAKGDGVPKDLNKAREMYEKGCPVESYGYDACNSLGEMYEKGEGVAKDKGRAAELFMKSCGSGACLRSGAIWEKGDGVKADAEKALAAYHKGCHNMGDMKACVAEGKLLEKQDKEKAKALYEDVCKRMRDKAMCDSLKRLGGTPPAK